MPIRIYIWKLHQVALTHFGKVVVQPSYLMFATKMILVKGMLQVFGSRSISLSLSLLFNHFV
jgi:hypothetical protein